MPLGRVVDGLLRARPKLKVTPKPEEEGSRAVAVVEPAAAAAEDSPRH